MLFPQSYKIGNLDKENSRCVDNSASKALEKQLESGQEEIAKFEREKKVHQVFENSYYFWSGDQLNPKHNHIPTFEMKCMSVTNDFLLICRNVIIRRPSS